MNIGKQIKALRLRRGLTQEALAKHLMVTPQAISKWENGTASPDISLLPELSAYFGVSIDELFALSDGDRMTRIQNMLCDARFIDKEAVEGEILFLQEKAKREPNSSQALELLANLELHLASSHQIRAAEYAREAIARDSNSARGYTALAHAMNGRHVDPRNNLHNELISVYKDCISKHPDSLNAYTWLIAQLIDDGRLTDGQGHIVNFTNTIIIMTSNLPDMNAVKSHFRPEFINRIDEIVFFNELGKDVMAGIVKIQLRGLEKRLAERHISLHVSDKAIKWLAEKGYDAVFGARPLKRLITSSVEDKIADLILAGKVGEGSTVHIDVSGKDLTVK